MESQKGIEQSASELRQGVEREHGLETEITRKHVENYFDKKTETHERQSSVSSEVLEGEPPSYDSQELKPEVDRLVRIVETKNLDAAIAEAYKSNNPAVFKAFRSFIVEELYNHLVEAKQLAEPPL